MRSRGVSRRPTTASTTRWPTYGEAIQLPLSPRRSAYLPSRPEHAEHVLAANQDKYVKAFTYRPLRVLIGNGLTSESGVG
jgi:hypothetical protein